MNDREDTGMPTRRTNPARSYPATDGTAPYGATPAPSSTASYGATPTASSTASYGATPAASGTGAYGSTPNPASTGAYGATPAASSTGAYGATAAPSAGTPAGSAYGDASAAPAPRYVRQRTPHRSQGTLDDLNDDSMPSASYTHDSNISVGGATPLSGRAYRRARNNMNRVGNTRYGQYLEIPKGRRSIFASRERARRRNSVLALILVIGLLVLAAMFIWNMMQNVLG